MHKLLLNYKVTTLMKIKLGFMNMNHNKMCLRVTLKDFIHAIPFYSFLSYFITLMKNIFLNLIPDIIECEIRTLF